MPRSDAKRRANNKYDREHMTVLGCKVRRDYADKVRARAAEQGTTVNAIFRRALADFMQQTSPGPAPDQLPADGPDGPA